MILQKSQNKKKLKKKKNHPTGIFLFTHISVTAQASHSDRMDHILGTVADFEKKRGLPPRKLITFDPFVNSIKVILVNFLGFVIFPFFFLIFFKLAFRGRRTPSQSAPPLARHIIAVSLVSPWNEDCMAIVMSRLSNLGLPHPLHTRLHLWTWCVQNSYCVN